MIERILEVINETASSLINSSQWHSSGEPFGHIDDTTQEDYIYEFYCFTRIVDALREDETILVRFDNSGRMGNLFPKKPAEKNNGWAKFTITDREGAAYDICNGIKIHHSETEGYTAAPDISIMKSGQDIPYENDIYLIMDAKYKSDRDAVLNISELREFADIVADFSFERGDELSFRLNQDLNFHKNAIITNRNANNRKIAYSSRKGFAQVGNFTPGQDHTVLI